MNKKLTGIAAAVAVMCSGVALAGPCGIPSLCGRGGGFHGGFRGHCAPVRYHGGFRGGHFGGYRGYYGGGYRHHYHGYRGLGLAAGIVGLAGLTSAIVHDWVAPSPVVVAPSPVVTTPVVTTPVYAPAPVVAAPAYAPAPVVTTPVVTTPAYAPTPVVYRY